MKIEYQLQIDAIKGNRIFYADFENITFISDGKIGVYLSKSELKIDKSKMISIKENIDNFNPKKLLEGRTKAIETNFARKLSCESNFAIKLQSTENNNSCYVNQKYLKMFVGFNGLFIGNYSDLVLVYKYGNPYGIILPIAIRDEEQKAD